MNVRSNTFGKCRSAGYFAKPVAFRTFGLERGGTSRDARFVNNLFYDCKEAAMKFPTEHNKSEGNAFVRMLGGYLRVMYPAPEELLHLPAWREFHGFDREGREGWFDIEIDTDAYTLKFVRAKDDIPGFANEIARRDFAYSVEELKGVPVGLLEETSGIDRELLWKGENSVAGPISDPKENVLYRIDPRANKKR